MLPLVKRQVLVKFFNLTQRSTHSHQLIYRFCIWTWNRPTTSHSVSPCAKLNIPLFNLEDPINIPPLWRQRYEDIKCAPTSSEALSLLAWGTRVKYCCPLPLEWEASSSSSSISRPPVPRVQTDGRSLSRGVQFFFYLFLWRVCVCVCVCCADSITIF